MQKIMKLIESDSTIGFNNFQKTKIMIPHIIITTAPSPNTMLDQNTDIMYVYGIINKYNVFFESLFGENGDFFCCRKKNLLSCSLVVL